MKEKPIFFYQDFEDYLFNAIQLSRNLTFENCVDSDDVVRQLNLARNEVDLFLSRVNKYDNEMKELEPKGAGVAHLSLEGDR